MENEIKEEKCRCRSKTGSGYDAAGGGLYGFGFLGALVFYLQNAETFWLGVLGFLKALVWPAILVYKLLEFLVKY